MKKKWYNIYNQIKNFVINHQILIYLLISTTIVNGVVGYIEYSERAYARVVEEQMEEEIRVERESLHYYVTVIQTDNISLTKGEVLDVTDSVIDMLNAYSSVQCVEICPANGAIFYNMVYQGINKETLSDKVEDVATFLTYLDEHISSLWIQKEPNLIVSVNLLNENDYENVLLTSTNGEIVYNALDKAEKEGTTQDWIDWFYYEKGYIPTDAELKQFKDKQNALIYNKTI